jgi:hypothetical protein
MGNEAKCKCKHCGTELPISHTGPCPKCGKSGKVHEVSIRDTVVLHDGINIRQKRKGFGKFMVESIQGWFSSGDPKLKKGVHKVRIVDRENEEYHEVVENAETGEIIREVHEPLSHHKHQPKQEDKSKGG